MGIEGSKTASGLPPPDSISPAGEAKVVGPPTMTIGSRQDQSLRISGGLAVIDRMRWARAPPSSTPVRDRSRTRPPSGSVFDSRPPRHSGRSCVSLRGNRSRRPRGCSGWPGVSAGLLFEPTRFGPGSLIRGDPNVGPGVPDSTVAGAFARDDRRERPAGSERLRDRFPGPNRGSRLVGSHFRPLTFANENSLSGYLQ
jgi:hypothetical protein